MADFKDEISPEMVGRLAAELSRAWSGFDAASFADLACSGLANHELLRRVDHVAKALSATMPADFENAVTVLDGVLESASFTGWMALPVISFAADAGIEAPELALPVLARLSPRFSSEGPIRAYLVRYPELSLEFLRRWCGDPDEHVRRLVSECTRPRLPWAARLTAFVADPRPAIELLDALVDDPSAYVRRSVANHLNDISKDHPDIAVECATRWSALGTAGTTWVVRHGLRTLVKQGDPSALALLGFDPIPVRARDFVVTPAELAIGDALSMDVTLDSARDGRIVVDYVVHYASARGAARRRVFKFTTRDLVAGEPVTLTRRHAFRQVSVRRIYPGPHRVEIQVNGVVLAGHDVTVVAA